MKMIVLVFALFVSACSSTYLAVRPGQFSGKLDVRWIENDRFLFLSRTEEPFVFKRPDGQIIRPGPMYTDGGSIPRLLWGIKGYSPWGYAPAYIVHDWLFEAKHCQYSAPL